MGTYDTGVLHNNGSGRRNPLEAWKMPRFPKSRLTSKLHDSLSCCEYELGEARIEEERPLQLV